MHDTISVCHYETYTEGTWCREWGVGGSGAEKAPIRNSDVRHFSVSRSQFGFREDQWYFFEIGTFEGETQVWVNGQMNNSYTDPQPMDPGSIGLEVHLSEGSNSVYTFDDIAVCGIQAPFETHCASE